MMNLKMVIFSLLLGSQAMAVVDMKNANYANAWTDLIAPGSGYDLRIQRTYSSRSLFNGLTGFGWCTDLETKLEVTAESNLRLTECGGGLEISFLSKNFQPSQVNSTINTILEEVKKRNPKMKPQEVADLNKQLNENESLRDEFSRQLKLKGDIVNGRVYKANGRENENIVFSDNKYKRTLEDGTFQIFNTAGQMTNIHDRNGNYLKLTWKGETLTSVVDNNGRKLTFYYENNKLRKIIGPNNLTAEYHFVGEDLVKVTNSWKNTFEYKYDGFHNLTRVNYPDKTYKEITYNTDKDWVTQFRNRKGCIEKYTYNVDKESPKDHYWSLVEKKCNNVVTNKSTYEFFHQKRKDGLGKYLYRVKTDNNGELTDITYHEIFGKPILLIKNKSKTTYSYFDNGQVKTKEEDFRTTDFKYENKCQKVSEVEVKYYEQNTPINENGSKRKITSAKKKLAKTIKTQYKYENPKCNVIFAQNSEGQLAKIQYDSHGRIIFIEDQSKKIVKIQYEDRFGKPSLVERPGLGLIKVSYKSNGEIDKVQSPEGPSVAAQVGNVFNTVLDMLAPATSENSI